MLAGRRVVCATVGLSLALTACATIDPTPSPTVSSPTPALRGESSAPTGTSSIPTGSTPNAEAWTREADAPLALTEVAVAAHAGELWVAGGLDESGSAVGAVLRYDPAGDAWSRGPDLPEAVHHSALVSTGDAVLLVGGYLGSSFDQPTTAVRRLEPGADAWADAEAIPEARAAGAIAWDGSRVVFAGGVTPGGVTTSVLAFDGSEWTRVGDLPTPREHVAATSDQAGRTWILGGRLAGFESNLASAVLVDGDGLHDLGAPLTPRGGLAAFYVSGAGACAVGGEGPDGTFSEVECVGTDGSLTVLPPLEMPRHGLGAAVIDGVAYAALGGPEPGLFVSAVLESLQLVSP